jgi:DNA polymerase-3 subunit alpha
LVAVPEWGVRERLSQEKIAIGYYLSGHLFDEHEHEVRRFAKRKIRDLLDSREPQLLAGMVTDLRIINGQRGRVGIFKLDDKTDVIEAVANEEQLTLHPDLLKEDELIIVQGKAQPDRFSGGLRLNITQVWSLGDARCRFGKQLLVHVTGHPKLLPLLQEHGPRLVATDTGTSSQGLPVRVRIHAAQAQGDLDLGEVVRCFPTDAALSAWRKVAMEGKADIVYDAQEARGPQFLT